MASPGMVAEAPSTSAAPVSASVAMCAYAFDVVCAALDAPARKGAAGSAVAAPADVPAAAGVGVFVTFNERRGGDWALRGCIGTLSPTGLRPALRRYAAYSAFEDSRFSPIAAKELPDLQVAVSVLSGFGVASGGVYDWVIGVHGIVLTLFPGEERECSATYLPEVCPEQGWTKEECIASLAKKAGYRRALDAAALDVAKLQVYVSSKAALTYEDYCKL